MILPVVGLLLLLGLFWYWASTLIGDDDDNPNSTTPTTQAVVIDDTSTVTATATTSSNINPTESSGQPAGETPTAESGEEETPTEEATEEATSASDTFAEGDEVTVNDDEVNLRAEASIESESLEVLSSGQALTITGPAIAAEDYIWWPVDDVENDIQGYVVEEYLDPPS